MVFLKASYLIPILILVVALPTGAALLHFQMTNDPTLRPLGLTERGLAESEIQGRAQGVTVLIIRGAENTYPIPNTEIETAIIKSLRARGVEYSVDTETVPGTDIQVFYTIGPNQFGPYSPTNAALGVKAAVAAYNLTK